MNLQKEYLYLKVNHYESFSKVFNYFIRRLEAINYSLNAIRIIGALRLIGSILTLG